MMLSNDWNIYLEYYDNNSNKPSNAIIINNQCKQHKNTLLNNKQCNSCKWLNNLSLAYTIKHDFPMDFWCWYNNYTTPYYLPNHIKSIRIFKSNCDLLKENIINGGRIIINYNIISDNNIYNFNQSYLNLLLLIITSDIKAKDTIGIVAKPIKDFSNKIKSGDYLPIRIEIWLDSIDSYNDFIDYIKINILDKYSGNYSISFSAFADEIVKMSDIFEFNKITNVKSVCNDIILNYLESKKYNSNKISEWVDNINNNILSQLKDISPNFKYIVTSTIIQNVGAGLHIETASYWDANSDGAVIVQYENDSLICLTTVFGLAL